MTPSRFFTRNIFSVCFSSRTVCAFVFGTVTLNSSGRTHIARKWLLHQNLCFDWQYNKCLSVFSVKNPRNGDGNTDVFSPQFDGQLFFGIPSDNDGNIQTTISEIEQKIGLEESISATVPDPKYRERATLRRTPIISRTIPIPLVHDPNYSVTVWEMEKPSEIVQLWMTGSQQEKERIGDPFGVVLWPGSIIASQEMAIYAKDIIGKTVLILGAGLGVEAQTAAKLGAKCVIAADINTFTLRLLRHGAEKMNLSHIIKTIEFDLLSSEHKLPQCDVMVVADVLYNEVLAKGVGERIKEVMKRNPTPRLIVTDSQRFHGTDFLGMLNEDKAVFKWKEVVLNNFTGSGILIEEDQTYDSKVRILSISGDRN